jgi:Na+-driven multidrug efflux pump
MDREEHMQKYTAPLGTAPLGGLLVKLSLPGMAATVSTSLYDIVDTIWVTRIGTILSHLG